VDEETICLFTFPEGRLRRRKAYVSEDSAAYACGSFVIASHVWGKDALAGSSVLRRRLHLALSSRRGVHWILSRMCWFMLPLTEAYHITESVI
jgi:hypothetical protein